MKPNLQAGLFKYSLEELCKEAKCSTEELKFLKQEKLLSFPLDKKQYEEYEINEAKFLVALLHSGLPMSRIKILLQKLEKPYAYSDIYYDFIRDSWVEKPINCDEDISLVEEYIDDYLDYLEDGDNKDELERIFKSIKMKLKELKE